MKILILGATGMLGHKLMQFLSRFFEVTGSVRRDRDPNTGHPVLKKSKLIGNVNAFEFNSVKFAIKEIHPDVIINCIGIVKQTPGSKRPCKKYHH